MMNQKQQIEMCGETFAELKDGFENCLGHKMVYVSGFLSDAQEMMAHGQTEGARKTLNAAKYLLSLIVEKDLS
jgi:hypothetical protein